MALNPLSDWQQSYKELKKVLSPIWSTNMGGWYNTELATIGTTPLSEWSYGQAVLDTSAGLVFTFDLVGFLLILSKAPQTIDQVAAAKEWAGAWAYGLSTPTPTPKIVVAPGAIRAPPPPPPPFPTPPTPPEPPPAPPLPIDIFSVITTAEIDPPSIVDGQDLIEEKMSKKHKGVDSKIPEIFREATTRLTVTVTGFDSTPGTPLPLVVANVPLV